MEGLQVRFKRRKELTRPRVPMALPNAVNDRWSMGVMSDQLATGRRFRVLDIVDDYNRECVLQIVDTSICGQRLARELERLDRPLPRTIVVDNGPAPTSKAMYCWSKRAGVKLHLIQPGKPIQNAFIESFNGRFQEHCLDLPWFASLKDARATVSDRMVSAGGGECATVEVELYKCGCYNTRSEVVADDSHASYRADRVD